jgi:hypothetical protein
MSAVTTSKTELRAGFRRCLFTEQGVFNSLEVVLHRMSLTSASKRARSLLLMQRRRVCLQWKHVTALICLENA